MNSEIKTAIEAALAKGICDFGIRSMTNNVVVAVGDEIENSYQWEDGETTDTELDGVSTVGFSVDCIDGEITGFEAAMKTIADYNTNEQIIIVGGNHNTDEVHNDRGEKVINNAVCIAIV